MQPHRGHRIILRLRWGWPIAKAPARLRCRVEPCRASALPGTHPGTAAMLPDGSVPSLPPKVPVPPHCYSSLGKVRRTSATGSAWQGWGYPACHCQGTPQLLPCVLPHASCQHPARAVGCAVCQGLGHAPELCRAQDLPYGAPAPTCARGSLGRCAGGRWPGWAAESEARWARAGLSCCSWRRAAGACLLLRQPCQARGGTCPHRALAKVRQRKVHAGGGPRVTQQCPVPRLAGTRLCSTWGC